MKTVPAILFIAAIGAFVLLPLSFEVAGSALFAAGFLSIMFSDYARRARSLGLPAVAAAVPLAQRRSERFGLAA